MAYWLRRDGASRKKAGTAVGQGLRKRKGRGGAQRVTGKEQSQGAQGLGPAAGGRRGCRAQKVQRAFN
jgi:hypothetical protein